MFPATSQRVFACSEACQQVHVACRGCGVLDGPDHFHLIRDGYCYALLSQDAEGGPIRTVLIAGSCWNAFRSGRLAGVSTGAA